MPEQRSGRRGWRTGPAASSQAYDQTMRRLVAPDVVGLCRLLGVRVEGDGPEPAGGTADAPVLGARFPGRQVEADLLVRVGPRRLLHVEFQLRAGPGLAGRILRYRAAISHAYPADLLDQVVVVLGTGDLDSVDDPADQGERPGFRLDGPTIDMAKEASMSTDSMADFYADIADFYDETWIGRELRQRGHADGVEAGRAEALAALIVERFGERPDADAVATLLARRGDVAATFRQVLAATSYESLTQG